MKVSNTLDYWTFLIRVTGLVPIGTILNRETNELYLALEGLPDRALGHREMLTIGFHLPSAEDVRK